MVIQTVHLHFFNGERINKDKKRRCSEHNAIPHFSKTKTTSVFNQYTYTQVYSNLLVQLKKHVVVNN